jgi:4-alpha-glucanotransferase
MTQKKQSTSAERAAKQRSAGILCHLTSIPGSNLNGDLTFAHCKSYIDWLSAAGQSYWQVLPLNPIGSGNSPYSSICSFAGDPLFISITELAEEGLIPAGDLRKFQKIKSSESKVNYAQARKYRQRLLRLAFESFKSDKKFKQFETDHSHWLDNFAVFRALSSKNKTTQWNRWPTEQRDSQSEEVKQLKLELTRAIEFEKFCQFQFFTQWARVKAYANSKNIQIIGDIPIFVSHESSDVWGAQKNFVLNTDGSPKVVAGVPPDYFNADGQLWGNALFDWQYMKQDNFTWWLSRLRHMTSVFDVVRLDHFIGFYRYWEIPADAKTAKTGTWRLAEGDALLGRYLSIYGSLPFIAEDLGIVTKEVIALREKYQLPAMKVLQLAFGNDGSAPGHLPFNYQDPNCVVYTGTHDNDTTAGWYNTARKARKKKHASFDFAAMEAFCCNTDAPHWSFIADALKSTANLAIIPLQDVAGLGSHARMNIPGTVGKNWEWRAKKSVLTKTAAAQLAAIINATKRQL